MLLANILQEKGYKVRPATNGEQALKAISIKQPDLVLLDIMMPEMDGFEVCKRLKDKEETRNIPIIFISALDDVDARVKGFEIGGLDYITKPFQAEEVLARINNQVQLHFMRTKLEVLVDDRTKELSKITKNLEQSTKLLHTTLLQTIHAIGTTLEKRDPYTAGHQQRVSNIAVAIAKELNLSSSQIEGINLGSLIHDIGKIYIPAEILSRPGKLTDIEFELIKTHPQVGYDIIKDVDYPWPIAEMILQHHERIDGSGYPNGVKSDKICLEAKIIAVADVVEAMASHRPYRAKLGIDKALGEIERGMGLVYDERVSRACIKIFKETGFALE